MMYAALMGDNEGFVLVTNSTPWPAGSPPLRGYCVEDERLTVLASFAMDDLQGDDELSRLAAFAARLCKVPTALVSIVEEQRQRFLAHEGLEATETPRDWSFCAYAMTGAEPMIIRDAHEDPTFSNNPLVTGEPYIRFYAGIPLISAEGAPLGSLCVLDSKPRPEGLNDFQLEGLKVLALSTKRRLESHRYANQTMEELRSSAQRVQFVLDSVPDIAWSAAPGPKFDYFNARWHKITGLPAPESVDDWRAVIHPDDYEASELRFNEAVEKVEAHEDQFRFRQADGSYRWVLSRAIPSTDSAETARWFGTLTDIDDAHRISEERELLAGELAHRIKNIFSVVNGLISLHSRGDKTMQVFGDMLTANIRALSRAQEFALQIGTPSEDKLDRLLGVLMAPYGTPGNSRVSISGDAVPTGSRASTPIALAFHELATNSAKYGALSSADGKISIDIAVRDERVIVTWREEGGPETKAPEGTGFGSRLLMMSINRQLGGEIELEWKPEGLHAVITLPLDKLAQ